ncbi:unnamed protein product [Ectocarpus sp. CCAP 1310/34]|nr:unnamed protein product [Ectocarpus sp. CCAP 1310/34]
MFRHHPNEHECFLTATKTHAQELEELLEDRAKETKKEWDKLDSGWEALEFKMNETGMSTVSSFHPSIVRLDVGGLDVNIAWSVLREKVVASSSSWTLGDLFKGGVWDKRLPSPEDGRIVLDESPVCVEEILSDGASSKRSGSNNLPDDEKPYIGYVASALGLGLQPGMVSWQADRASRDSWSDHAFHARCGDDSPSTISLFCVEAQGANNSDSVVGRFSVVPWTASPEFSPVLPSPGSFLFMLKDGNEGSDAVQPSKWGPKVGYTGQVVDGRTEGPVDWVMCLHRMFTVHCGIYDIPTEHPFLYHMGREVVDIEVFRVLPTSLTVTGLIDCAAYFKCSDMSAEEHENDVYRFGMSIAGSLRDERAALHTAQRELVKANTIAAASVEALAAVYGPNIAAGVEDRVVELSVRGPRKTERMTTLLSTLQACPESALAARFDEAKWPVTDKEKDAHGRRVIKDCSPLVFAKVLDVLRMKKREAWADDDKKVRAAVLVAIKAADRAPFEKFVNMYFPACESFIMDSVKFLCGP